MDPEAITLKNTGNIINMENWKKQVTNYWVKFENWIIILSMIVLIFYITMWRKNLLDDISQVNFDGCSSSNKSTMVGPKDELGRVLEKTSMGKNKTLIIAIINEAYVETRMLDLFIESIWHGNNTQSLMDQILLVAVDEIAYEQCKISAHNCYKLDTNGVDFSGEEMYMSNDFNKMMWERTQFLAEVLKRGYNFIFTDTDVMWLSNPFKRLSLNEDYDVQISCDYFDGNELSKSNPINTGFYFIRSNNKTISLFDTWYSTKDDSTYEGMKEQDILQNLMQNGVLKQLGLKVRFLDTLYFSGFCQGSKDFRVVSTVHANCCRSIQAKVADLTVVLEDWRHFITLERQRLSGPVNVTQPAQWSKHVACRNSWKRFNATLT